MIMCIIFLKQHFKNYSFFCVVKDKNPYLLFCQANLKDARFY